MFASISAGSPVAIVAPAGPVPAAAFEAGLAILAARYEIVHGGSTPAAAGLPYLAGDDERRAGLFNAAIRDRAIEAVFCARGGYGSMRILPLLEPDELIRRRPPLVGFSDITAIHAWAAGHGVPSVHGPVVTQLSRLPDHQVQAMFDLLEGTSLPALSGLETLVDGRATGALFGGNLSLLSHLCGTSYLPPLDGKILLLEEVSESPYRLDRALTQLLLSGQLPRVAGVVVGALHRCDAPQGVPPREVKAVEVIRDRLGGLGVPVACGAPVGHGDLNLALPLGAPATLDASAGTLTF